MKVKNKEYTKSPVKVSTLLPKILKPIKKKFGSKLLEIKFNWEKIIGKEIASKCFISSLYIKNNKRVLIVISNNNEIFELAYSSELIKKKN